MNENDFVELAAGYALNALSPEDERAYEDARRQHPEWERHVRADAATAALLADGVSDIAPPPELRASLLAQITRLPQSGATAPSDPEPQSAPERQRRWGARGWFALAASIVLLVGVGWGAVFVGEQLRTPASIVALDQIDEAPDAQSGTVALSDGGTATAHWSESIGKAVLVSDGLPTIAEDQSFEAWFVRDGAAISAGAFTADDGSATALLAGALEPGDVIAVTVEASGGSPTGQPTSDPIVVIPTA